MKLDETHTFAEALKPLGEAFRVSLTEGLLHGYWLALEDLSIEKVQKGCLKSLRYEDRFPAPATIRRYGIETGVVL